jgi:hypothetical protein
MPATPMIFGAVMYLFNVGLPEPEMNERLLTETGWERCARELQCKSSITLTLRPGYLSYQIGIGSAVHQVRRSYCRYIDGGQRCALPQN